jgi:hypothetical protein
VKIVEKDLMFVGISKGGAKEWLLREIFVRTGIKRSYCSVVMVAWIENTPDSVNGSLPT